jgi:hypothetical protein
MKITQVIVLAFLPILLGACAVPSTSTGYITEGINVPKKVGVIPFDGDFSIANQATGQFANELKSLGFEVVESSFEGIPKDSMPTTEIRIKLREQFGIEGIYYGNIRGTKTWDWVDTYFNIQLVNIETGRVVWTAEVHDPRSVCIDTSQSTSVKITIKNAMKILKKDLKLK